MGDARSYEFVCALRAVTSSDGMTADSYAFSHEFLSRTATRIVNEVHGVRVAKNVGVRPVGGGRGELQGGGLGSAEALKAVWSTINNLKKRPAPALEGPAWTSPRTER